jgi:hypothetical protein
MASSVASITAGNSPETASFESKSAFRDVVNAIA